MKHGNNQQQQQWSVCKGDALDTVPAGASWVASGGGGTCECRRRFWAPSAANWGQCEGSHHRVAVKWSVYRGSTICSIMKPTLMHRKCRHLLARASLLVSSLADKRAGVQR